jgi:sugar/nucleoside kinase (ribokinase family)
VLDGCGAGATFSASFIYGYLQGWELGDIARFAVASASLKCARIGLQLSPLADVWQLAEELRIEQLTRESLE